MPQPDDLQIALDFTAVQRNAEHVRAMLLDARARIDLARFEYCRRVRALHFYRWIYQTVIDDGEALGALYREQGLLPIRPATEMSADDFKLAALMDESPAH